MASWRHLMIVFGVLALPGALPATAAAWSSPSCDPVDNAAANVWDGEPGLWSDPQHWSLGTIPDDTNDVCIGVLDGDAVPGMDVDAEARTLQSTGTLVVPVGHSLTVNGIWTERLAIEPGAEVQLTGPDASAGGTWAIAGTARFGLEADLYHLALRSEPADTMTLDADGLLRVSSLDVGGDLHLVDDTELVVDENPAEIRGSISGGLDASLRGMSVITVGSLGAPSSDIDVDVAGALHTRGDVSITGRVIGTEDTGGFIGVIDGTVELAGGVISSGYEFQIGAVPGTTAVPEVVRVTSGAPLDTSMIRIGDVDIELVDCAPTSRYEALRVSGGTTSVHDADCIDPGPGLTRSLSLEQAQDTALVFAATMTLDAGGTLVLPDRLAIAAGTRLTDGATTLETNGLLHLDVAGTGRAEVARLLQGSPNVFDGWSHPIEILARPDQVFALVDPALAGTTCARSTQVGGGGRVEVITTMPLSSGCVEIDQAEDGSAPVRYVASGTVYEPERNWVTLYNATWSPTSTVRAGMVAGSGTMSGTFELDHISASGGTLAIRGSLTAQGIGIHLPAPGVLDLTRATTQNIASASIAYGGAGGTTYTAAAGQRWTALPGLASVPPISAVYRVNLPSGTRFQLEPYNGTLSVAAVPLNTVVVDPVVPPVDDPVVDPTSDVPVRTGSPGADRMIGTNARDRLHGASGADLLRGLGGNDRLDGGLGRDHLDGGAGNDIVNGGNDADVVLGGPGSDDIYGANGDDRLGCGTGLRDRALGGLGNDVISCVDRGAGRDIIDCGPGRDRAVVDRRDVVKNCEVVVRR